MSSDELIPERDFATVLREWCDTVRQHGQRTELLATLENGEWKITITSFVPETGIHAKPGAQGG
jgi:hypothetical protein